MNVKRTLLDVDADVVDVNVDVDVDNNERENENPDQPARKKIKLDKSGLDIKTIFYIYGTRNKYDKAVARLETIPADEKESLYEPFLNGLAYKGLIDSGLKFIRSLDIPLRQDIRKKFIIQLVINDFIEIAQHYVETTPASAYKRELLRTAFISGLAEADKVKEALEFIKPIKEPNNLFLYEALIGIFAEDADVISFKMVLDEVDKKNHSYLIQSFIENFAFKLSVKEISLELMSLINDEDINDVVAYKLAAEKFFTHPEAVELKRWAHKIAKIKERYKVYFEEAKAISELSLGLHTWVAGHKFLLFQKNIPQEATNQIAKYALCKELNISFETSDGAIEAVAKFKIPTKMPPKIPPETSDGAIEAVAKFKMP